MHLHIGKNNVIGRAFSSKENVKVISSNLLYGEKLSNYYTISISAFDRDAKCKITGADNMIKDIVTRSCPDSEIIYFSTARVLSGNGGKNYYFYVKNKLAIEKFLINNHQKVKIIYLPNIIPRNHKDRCDFIDTYIKNLEMGRVEFNCSLESSWNFVSANKLIEACLAGYFVSKRTLFLSTNAISVSDLVKYARRNTTKPLKILTEKNTKHYPVLDTVNLDILYSDSDESDNKLLWIKTRQLGNKNEL